MTYNQSHRNNYPKQGARPFKKKPLTEYKPGLAFQRINFYLDVLEAHFAKLGVILEQAQGEGRASISLTPDLTPTCTRTQCTACNGENIEGCSECNLEGAN
jgi:hypothetical protein